jgi:hypothetical protein
VAKLPDNSIDKLIAINMDTASLKVLKPTQELGRYQFSLRRMFVATTAVAAVFGLAAWGGWVHSDAVVYLSIAVLASVFSSTARRTLLGSCVILGAFWISLLLGGLVFGYHGRGVGQGAFWIFAGLLTVFAMILRLYTKAGAFSLVTSLLLTEIFTAMMIVYISAYPTLFEAFANNEHRAVVLVRLRGNFPIDEQWLIVVPWLAGIVFGEILARQKSADNRQEPLL